MLFIKNGLIYTMNSQIVNNGSILIKDGKIIEVGRDIIEHLDVKVIDAEGRMITPGFIEAHSHIGMDEESIGFEGNDVNEGTNPITPELRAIDGINPMDEAFKEAYQAGITTAITGPGS